MCLNEADEEAGAAVAPRVDCVFERRGAAPAQDFWAYPRRLGGFSTLRIFTAVGEASLGVPACVTRRDPDSASRLASQIATGSASSVRRDPIRISDAEIAGISLSSGAWRVVARARETVNGADQGALCSTQAPHVVSDLERP